MSNDYPPPPPPPPSSPPPYGYGYGYGAPPPRPFSAGDAFGYGWKTFWRHPGPFILVALLMMVVSAVVNAIGSGLTRGEASTAGLFNGAAVTGTLSGVSLLFSFLAAVATVFFNAALVRGALDAADGRPVTVGSMFERWDKGAVLVAALIVGALSTIGTILCILPGIAVTFLAWFTTFFVIDRGAAAWQSVKASFSFTSGHLGPLLLCALLGVVTLVIGALLCGVGLLFAVPIVVLAGAYAFRALHGQQVAAP